MEPLSFADHTAWRSAVLAALEDYDRGKGAASSDIIKCIMQGMTDRAIAEKFYHSVRSMGRNIQGLYQLLRPFGSAVSVVRMQRAGIATVSAFYFGRPDHLGGDWVEHVNSGLNDNAKMAVRYIAMGYTMREVTQKFQTSSLPKVSVCPEGVLDRAMKNLGEFVEEAGLKKSRNVVSIAAMGVWAGILESPWELRKESSTQLVSGS